MISYFKSKDKRIRIKASKIELDRINFFFMFKSNFTDLDGKKKIQYCFSKKFHKNMPFAVKPRNRCIVTTRAGSVFRFFKLSRITLKDFASRGVLTGVSKSSW